MSGGPEKRRAALGSGLAADPVALITMADALRNAGKAEQAAALARTVLAAPGQPPATTAAARAILAAGIPVWHASMLADSARNDAFEAAIVRALGPATRVLDIGAGSGLLSLIAARAGATSVVACEANPALAATAAEIVVANGYAEKIRVLAKRSTDLDAGADLEGGADLIVAEIFSDDLILEGALPSLEDARTRLAADGARIIPQAASIRVAPAWLDGAPGAEAWEVKGFDLSLFERHTPAFSRVRVGERNLQLRGAAADLFAFDFQHGTPLKGRTRLDLAVEGGPANGIVQWIRLQLDAVTAYENRPAQGARSHWAASFYRLPGSLLAEPGGSIALGAAYDRDRLHLWFG